MTKTGIEQLRKVLYAIHNADTVYWRSKDRTREAIAEYHRRQWQLEAIRIEIAQLKVAEDYSYFATPP